jgi:hypothetical protein
MSAMEHSPPPHRPFERADRAALRRALHSFFDVYLV